MVKRLLVTIAVLVALSVAGPRDASADGGRCYWLRPARAWVCIDFPSNYQCWESVDTCIDASGGCAF